MSALIERRYRQRAPFSEILFWIFAHRLWDAVRREILRGYVTIEDRLDVLNGRWLVAAQAGRPDGWRRDRFDVAYDEFTEDNLPNRLFQATVHRLLRWAQQEVTAKYTNHTKSSGGTRSVASAFSSVIVARPSRLRLFPRFIILPSSFCLSPSPVPATPKPSRSCSIRQTRRRINPQCRRADTHEPTLRGMHRRTCPP